MVKAVCNFKSNFQTMFYKDVHCFSKSKLAKIFAAKSYLDILQIKRNVLTV